MAQRRPPFIGVTTRDGRTLAVEESGAPDGTPVFLLHGTPGSRSGPRPRPSVLYRRGIRLVSYDRPGYGSSDRHPDRTVADSALDVEDVADALGLGSFAVVGRSGGGPHALACAAVLGERITRLAVLVGLAPADAPDLDWYEGMSGDNTEKYSSVDTDQQALLAELTELAERVRSDPASLVEHLDPDLSTSDRRVIGNVTIRRLLTATYAEAVRQGPAGWIDDVLAVRRPWKFELSSIATPTLLWHGDHDQFSPVGHTRWLARCLPESAQPRLAVAPDLGHFGAVEVLPSILTWAASGTWSEGLAGIDQPAAEPALA